MSEQHTTSGAQGATTAGLTILGEDQGAYLAEARQTARTLAGSLDYLVQLHSARSGRADAALLATFQGLSQQARRVAELLGECA